MKILTNEKISENKYKTSEGYLVCIDAILARTGSQTYLSKELFEDGDDTQIDVLRQSSEVFSPRTITSFENKPITIEHPDEFVNIKNYKKLSVGFVRDVRKKVIEDNEFLVGNLIITDEQAIKEIEDNGMKYLSCGYECDIVEEKGKYFQKNIRGNHVALCFSPRAGNTQIVDSQNIIRNSIYKVIECIDSINYNNFSEKKLEIIKKMLKQIVRS